MDNTSNLKSAVLELRNIFAQHLPTEDVTAVLRKAVEKALVEVLGNVPKRRGRPPKSATAGAPASSSASAPKKRVRTADSLRKQAAKMRAYWRAKKAAEATKSAPKRKPTVRAKSKATSATVETT